MMIWVKRIGLALLILIGVGILSIAIFMYKAKNGFPIYETDRPEIIIPNDQPAVLLFSKTTAFRHGEAIQSLASDMDSIARSRNWYLFKTEEGGVFNSDQLPSFDVVIWNNSTGPVLTKEQRAVFQEYIKSGGGFVGIHGAGDFSHKWEWYTKELIGADFSHHPIKNQIQPATVYLSADADSSWTTPPLWTQRDEWYVFYNSPAQSGVEILYWIDGETIDPSGNLLFIKDKDFGMGSIHPVSWTKNIGQGRSFYTSMGHNKEAVSNPNYLKMLVGAIEWAGRL